MEDKRKFVKKALLLEYITVGYNILEGIFSILAGYLAGSIALVGFGLDSGVESVSGGVLIWRLLKHGKSTEAEEEEAESKAIKFVGYSFFILAAYVFFESARKLYFHEMPDPSLFGIIIAILSIITMPVLSYAKLKTARQMGSKSLEADSRETLVCALLSVALLIGLGLNYLYGLWWADPVSALVIVGFIVKEGFETLEEAEEGE
ncbi:MAG: cation transporter [Deltaproteobacteria bacterium]|nr:cation transporter [Deltaproteobacteria bacterium]